MLFSASPWFLQTWYGWCFSPREMRLRSFAARPEAVSWIGKRGTLGIA